MQNAEKQNGSVSQMNEKFLVFTEKYAPVDGQAMIVTNDFDTVQEFVEAWFEDRSVIRIYQLNQCYAIVKVQGQ